MSAKKAIIPPLTEEGPAVTGLVGNEAALVGATVVGVVEAIVTCLLAFGIVDWTTEQTAAFLGAVSVTLTAAAGLWVRSKVWSKSTVNAIDPAALVK